MEKHTIWSNIGLDIDDWRDDLLEYYGDMDDDKLSELMRSINNDYLDDERCNLNVTVPGTILCVADLGLWYGNRVGFKTCGNNIRNILYDDDCDYCDWYADEANIRFTGHHHDGTNTYLYRVFTGDEDDLYEMTADEMLDKTESLLPYVAKVYGW